jgi:hypothetical protein
MACSKYILTNTGSTIVTFNYRRCDDGMWSYQVELEPNQTKNIWLVNNTYSSANVTIVVDNEGAFPPTDATPTPTPTPTNTPTQTTTPTDTPSVTTTPTDTPSVTPTPSSTPEVTTTPTPTGTPNVTATPTDTPSETPTPTPTNILRTTLSNICHDETDPSAICGCPSNATIFVNGTNMADSTLAWSDQFGANTGNPEGYYLENNTIYQVASGCGPGCIVGAAITVYGTCPTPTPTQTPTDTPTVTSTPTNTPTQTVTPTSPLVAFTVFTGATQQEACNSSTSITLYGINPLFDSNTQFYNESTGVVTIDLTGYFVNSGYVIELDSNGAIIGGFSLCSLVPTPTTTSTPTQTPTDTPSVTSTPTPTFAWYTYSLGTGDTPNNACAAFGSSPQTIYGTIAGGVGPNVGEYLYETAGRPLTDAVPDGFYSNGTAWFQVSGGLGQITFSVPNGCSNLVTPTPSPTNTQTPTQTPTDTPSVTPTPSETPAVTPTPTVTPEVYNLIFTNSATTSASIIYFADDSGNIPLTNATGSLPLTSGQTLSADHGLTDNNPNIYVSGTGFVNFVITINGIVQQSSSTGIPANIGVTVGGVPLLLSDVIEFTISDF